MVEIKLDEEEQAKLETIAQERGITPAEALDALLLAGLAAPRAEALQGDIGPQK
jgi:hypothetical protein